MTMKAVDLLVSGAADGGVQHCGSGVEAEQRWHVWAGSQQRANEWILTQGPSFHHSLCISSFAAAA